MSDTRRRMMAEHAELARALESMQNAVEGADAPTLVEEWTRFERGVLSHFDYEERHFFPRLEATEPALVDQLREDHARIRRRIAELGVSVDLKTLRSEAADDLADMLRAHAEREDRSLYPWVEMVQAGTSPHLE